MQWRRGRAQMSTALEWTTRHLGRRDVKSTNHGTVPGGGRGDKREMTVEMTSDRCACLTDGHLSHAGAPRRITCSRGDELLCAEVSLISPGPLHCRRVNDRQMRLVYGV